MKYKEVKFHVLLPEILVDALDKAKESGQNRTDVLRAALIKYLKSNKF